MRCLHKLHCPGAVALVIAFAALFQSACDDKTVNGDDPPRVIPFIEYLSTSQVDDYVYFSFGGDRVNSKGMWRYHLSGAEPPQLIVPEDLAGAVSPCGDAVAYDSWGHLWLLRFPPDDPLSGTPELLLDVVHDGGVSRVHWRDCDHVLFTPGIFLDGVVEMDLRTGELDTLIDYGGSATASADGSVIAFVWKNNILVLH